MNNSYACLGVGTGSVCWLFGPEKMIFQILRTGQHGKDSGTAQHAIRIHFEQSMKL